MDQGLIKIVTSDSFNDLADSGASLIEDPRIFVKKASTIFGKEYEDMKPDKNHVGIHVVALGDSEHYGCFFAGAQVQTELGLKPIETLVVGDTVLTHMNRFKPILKTFKQPYTGIKVKLRVATMPDLVEMTADHPVSIIRSDKFSGSRIYKVRKAQGIEKYIEQCVKAAEFSRADTIEKGDLVILPCRPKLGNVETMDIDLAYFYGLYLAEACLVKDTSKDHDVSINPWKSILFTMNNTEDVPALAELEKVFIKYGKKMHISKSYTSDYGVRIEFNSKELAQKVATLFDARLAGTKFIPPAIFNQSEEFRWQFLAGYFDGDGCIITGAPNPRYENSVSCSSSSRNLAIDVKRLLGSLGVASTVAKCWNRVENGCFGHKDFPIYSLTIGGSSSWKLLQYTKRLRSVTPYTVKNNPPCSSWTDGKYIVMRVKGVEHEQIFGEYKYNLEVEEDNTYVTDIQGHNCNRNADFWPKKACEKYHHTFVKCGHVFVQHKNTDPAKAIGHIKASAYNADMGRVELFIHVNKNKGEEHLTRMEKEGSIPVSMAAKVRVDRCSICNNLRKSASDPNQCSHILTKMGTILNDGRAVGTYNDDPTWFDISIVNRPADRIAWDLKKVAAASEFMSGVELAKQAGIEFPSHLILLDDAGEIKYAVLDQMAGMENLFTRLTMSAAITCTERYYTNLYKAASTLTDKQVDVLRNYSPEIVFRTLVKQAVVLDPSSFFKYAFGTSYGELKDDMPAVLDLLASGFSTQLLKSASCNSVCNNDYFEVDGIRGVGYITDNFELNNYVSSEIADQMAVTKLAIDQRMIETTIANRHEPNAIKIATDAGSCNAAAKHAAELYMAYKLAAVKGILDNDKTLDKDLTLAYTVVQNLVRK